MGTKELRKRDTWQDYSGKNAGQAEHNFYDVFLKEFELYYQTSTILAFYPSS